MWLSGKSPHAAERRSVRRQESSILEALGNLGDFVGGVAVVVTLIYLAVQIRQNSRQMELNTASVQAAAYQAQLETTRLANMEIVRDKQLAEWTLISPDELQNLDRADRFRLELLCLGALRQRQHLFVQMQDGLVRSDLAATHDVGLRGLFGNPAMSELWSRSKTQFVPDFVRHVDGILSDFEAEPLNGRGHR